MNIGYTEYLIQADQEARRSDIEQLDMLIGRLAILSPRDAERLAEEELILRDQIFELERERIVIDPAVLAVSAVKSKAVKPNY